MNTIKAVSFSLPTWRSNIGYEEGEKWVIDSMAAGYPRFFIHKSIAALAEALVQVLVQPKPHLQAMLFPSEVAARRCMEFIENQSHTSATPAKESPHVHVVNLVLDGSNPATLPMLHLRPTISVVFFAPEASGFAKQYWQHTGDGITSRRAEYCHRLLNQGLVVPKSQDPPPISPGAQKTPKGPQRYQRLMPRDETAQTAWPRTESHTYTSTSDQAPGCEDASQFVEERFGRNLNISLGQKAKIALQRRIAGTLGEPSVVGAVNVAEHALPQAGPSSPRVQGLTEQDVYLYPNGMNAIFHTHRTLLKARGSMKSISFGFPYVDTLKILQKFGPGCVFYGETSGATASGAALEDLEARLEAGERFLGLFCEFPGNPLLCCPDLLRIRSLADKYDFAVIIDETIGTFGNVNVLRYADIVVSSLTKLFSGECNVMGGSAVFNPESRYYWALKDTANREYEDTLWAEDAIFLERNSRDFISRIMRINVNAEAIYQVLSTSPLVKVVYYPKYNHYDKANYDAVKLPLGGYGGLVSVVFWRKADAVAFYDGIETAKGPSLGTNFTLTSPYVLLAHYGELNWAAGLGVDPDLIRISVGLEPKEALVMVFENALRTVERESERVSRTD